MKTDLYTKTVLTIIALCLLWICLGGPSLMTPVQAQREPQDVVIAGWKGEPTSRNVNQLSMAPLPTSK
jgi:hypothetical protein